MEDSNKVSDILDDDIMEDDIMEDDILEDDILEDDILLMAQMFDWKMYRRNIGYDVAAASFAKICTLFYCFLIPLWISMLTTFRISMSITCYVILSSNHSCETKNGLASFITTFLLIN